MHWLVFVLLIAIVGAVIILANKKLPVGGFECPSCRNLTFFTLTLLDVDNQPDGLAQTHIVASKSLCLHCRYNGRDAKVVHSKSNDATIS